MRLQLLKADVSDALTLNGISKRAFDSDVFEGGSSAGGPPGYMSVSFHKKMARQGHLYKLTEEGLTVGQNGEEPIYKGIGQKNADFILTVPKTGCYIFSVTGHQAKGEIFFTCIPLKEE